MRRKVIQDFANVFCQRILLLPEGYDLASFAHYGSGTYELNILSGESLFNNSPIPKLKTCDSFKSWLMEQLEKHNIPFEKIEYVTLRVEVTLSKIETGTLNPNHEYAAAHFTFICNSEIGTDEKLYKSQMSGEKKWGFDWYYQQLYGSLLKLGK